MPTTPPARAPRTRGPSPEKTARTRAAIISAAMEEFLSKGFAAATMARIASRAGVAKGTLYLYFDTKEALFSGIVRDIITDPLGEARIQPMQPQESLLAYCQRSLLPVMSNMEPGGRAAVARLVLAESGAFPFLAETYRREVYLPFLEHMQRLITLAQETGQLCHPGNPPAPQLLAAPLWVGLIQNGVLTPDQPTDIGALFGQQLALIFRAPDTKPAS